VDFADRADMEYALKKMNDRELNGQRITLRLVRCTHKGEMVHL
jgi:arginine/serine-rich splicing factor 4/5/6